VEPTQQQRVAYGGVGRAGSPSRPVLAGSPIFDGRLGDPPLPRPLQSRMRHRKFKAFPLSSYL